MATAVNAQPRQSLQSLPATALGESLLFLQETDAPLTLAEAITAFATPAAQPARAAIPNFGIGARPVWLYLPLHNTGRSELLRRLSIETAWLDTVEIYLQHNGQQLASYQLGDRYPHAQRPLAGRFFAVDMVFPPGYSDVYIRVETPDPMVIPVYLRTPLQAQETEQFSAYIYGLVYGFLLALLAYNAMLWIGLRGAQYGYYAVYLAAFIAMNLSYTGHAFHWWWGNYPQWQLWAQPCLMTLFAITGLLFAMCFLHTRQLLPAVHRALWWLIATFVALQLIAVFIANHFLGILAAFVFAAIFSLAMLMLGIFSVRAGNRYASYFLLAAISTILGTASTTFAVWGFLPFNTFTYQAVEFGMLLDATLLALALSYQFRSAQQDKLRAEKMAETDPLTGLNNRRSFYQKVYPLWHEALYKDHEVAVILLDIDNFKMINDSKGHAFGDEVLMAVARLLLDSARRDDVISRWGGEEFIVFLPRTSLADALLIAERLRDRIAALRVNQDGESISFTASFGVAPRSDQRNLDALIGLADRYLYQSKERGRNQIHFPEAVSLSS